MSLKPEILIFGILNIRDFHIRNYVVANSSPQTVFYSCFYLLLQSFPQMHFLTLYFARCRLGLQHPPARCTMFVYCHDNRHVIISHFFIFCLCTTFLLFPPPPANRWLIAPSSHLCNHA